MTVAETTWEDTIPATQLPADVATGGDAHLRHVRQFYETAPQSCNWAGRGYRRILARYYKRMIPRDCSILEIGCGSGGLLRLLPNRDVTGVDLAEQQIEQARRAVPHGTFHVQAGEELTLDRTFDYIIVSDTINQAADVQGLFERLRTVAHAGTRLILNFHNTAWRPLFALATTLRIKARQPACNWLSPADVRNLLTLAGWEIIKQQRRVLAPVPLLGMHRVVNRLLAPLVPWTCLTVFQIARLAPAAAPTPKSVSVVIPARNEAGNIATAIERLPRLGSRTEVIFIEGHSHDDTWDVIQRVVKENPHLDLVALRQTGKGKGNAVREAFDAATGDILMILDADLTVPPEELTKFYNALVSGRAEFANGVRLVYPMERRAMRFLNLCANKFFGAAFTWALGQPIKDTLCGTKALFRSNYQRIAANRAYFGDFDPFGDFDLIFGADRLNLKIADIPIRYRDRTYGSTNISRWRHGLLLGRMLLVAVRKLKFV